MDKNIVQTFLDLVKIPSPSRNERTLADYIKQRLAAYPVHMIEDDTGNDIGGNCGNLIIKLEGVGTPILFDAHMDTVSPCERILPQIKNGTIHSDHHSILGADDKVGIAVLLCMIEKIFDENLPHPPITVLFTVCEEESLQGVKHLKDEVLENISYAYVLDGEGEIGSITTQTPYGCKGTLTVLGKEAHAGVNPQDGINALVVASEAIQRLKIGRIDEDTTCNIGVIQGGTATNVVMGQVEMKFEARSYKLEELKMLIEHVKSVFHETCSKHKAVFKETLAYGTPGYRVHEDEPILKTFQEVCEKENILFHGEPCGGGSNANIYRMRNVASLCLGTNMKNVHSVYESIDIVDLENLYKLVMGIVSYMKS